MKSHIAYMLDRYFIKQPKLRRAVTGLIEPNREATVDMFGARLRVNRRLEHGYWRAFKRSRHLSVFQDEAPVLLNLALLLRDGDTFVDVGANVGVYACNLARATSLPGCRNWFYAFEANPDTYARLVQSIGHLPVHAFNLALSNRAGTLEFFAGAVSHVFTTTRHANAYSIRDAVVRVAAQRLDATPILGESLVIKIDVEGQERDVLDGAEGLFRAGRVRAVYLDGYGDESVVALLKSHGFGMYDGRTLAPVRDHTFSLLAIREA